MSIVICPSCKTSAAPGAIFCDNCGFDLRAVSPVIEQAAEGQNRTPEQVSASLTCPNCGHANIAGSVFCENCGSQFSQKAPIQEPALTPDRKQIEPETLAENPLDLAASDLTKGGLVSIPGRLVNINRNVSIPIPTGGQSIMIGREDPISGIFPDIDLDPFGGHEAGVGRRHAKLFLQHGEVYIEDLDSVNGTVVNKKKLIPHEPFIIKHGDELRFGKLVFTYLA
jgi:predicted RNA-binding Zn-ribbon protein involved in translation (DUF1610 family)